MNFREEPVYFNSGSQEMFAIFHASRDDSQDYGAIFSNSGMQNRAGPHRLYTKFARTLANEGISVLRIDFPGIGESEGEVKETHFDAHNPEYTINAIDYMVNVRGIKNIFLYGLCAGARNAIKAAASDERVSGVVLWSVPIIWMPPIFPSPAKDPRGYMSKKGAMLTLKDRTQKALTIKGWKNYYAKGGSMKSIYLYLRSIFWNLVTNESKWSNLRHKDFFESMASYIQSGRKVFFLYGERDTVLIEEFRDKFNEITSGIDHQCEHTVIPNGNHSFTNIETEKQAVLETVSWLNKWKAGIVESTA